MASERTGASHWLEVDVAGALALRRWALRALAASDPEAADAAGEPPPQSPATWQAFLEAEMCAAPLARALASQRVALAPDIEAILERRSSNELKHVLAARAQLRTIADLAASEGVRAIALKGAIAIAAGFDLDLEDLDFLLAPDDARRAADALLDAGYQSQRGGSSRHLGMLYAPGGIGVELHMTLSRSGEPPTDDLWSAVIPHEGLVGLSRLNPAEHLWHILWHVAIDHPDRLGRIRDLLLTAHALGDCSERDIDAVKARIERSEMRDELERQLSVATALRQHRPIDDELWRSAAKLYTARRTFERLPIPERYSFAIWQWMFALLGRRIHRREMWAETMALTLAVSRIRPIAFLQRRAPRMALPYFIGRRLVKLPAILAAAAPLAGYVRLSLRNLERGHPRSD